MSAERGPSGLLTVRGGGADRLRRALGRPATLAGVRVDALDGPDVRARLHRRPVPGLALADRPAAVAARAIVAYPELHGAFPLWASLAAGAVRGLLGNYRKVGAGNPQGDYLPVVRNLAAVGVIVTPWRACSGERTRCSAASHWSARSTCWPRAS